MRGTEYGLHHSALSLVVFDVDNSETWTEKHLEQVSSLFLAGERARVRVNVLHRLGIRNHEVLRLRNQVTNDDKSQLKVMYSEEAINFEHLPKLLLPSDVGFSSLLEVDFREVSEEYVALPRTWDIRNGDTLVLTVKHAKEADGRERYSRMQERGLENTFE